MYHEALSDNWSVSLSVLHIMYVSSQDIRSVEAPGTTNAHAPKCSFVTQYNKRYILSTFNNKNEIFTSSNRRFNKLSNDTKFVKIEVILLKVQLLQSVYFLLFSLYFAHYFGHYLRINLADKMYLLLYWVTFSHWLWKMLIYTVIFPDGGKTKWQLWHVMATVSTRISFAISMNIPKFERSC